MKKIVILLLICSCFSCQYFENPLEKIGIIKPIFHVRINCFLPEYNTYYVQYTITDGYNWDNLNETFDISSEISSPNVCYQEKIFGEGKNDKLDAINFAKRFKNYNDVKHYQDSVYKEYGELISYRKLHLIKVTNQDSIDKVNEKLNSDCCKPQIVL